MKRYVALFLIIVSCNQPASLSEDQRKAIIAETTKMLDNYCEDVKKEGLMAEFKYLDDSEDFFWIPPGYKSAISYDSVAVVLKENASMKIDKRYDSLHIIPLNKEIASFSAIVRFPVADSTGKTSDFSLIESGVLIKRKDGWKFLNGQTTAVE